MDYESPPADDMRRREYAAKPLIGSCEDKNSLAEARLRAETEGISVIAERLTPEEASTEQPGHPDQRASHERQRSGFGNGRGLTVDAARPIGRDRLGSLVWVTDTKLQIVDGEPEGMTVAERDQNRRVDEIERDATADVLHHRPGDSCLSRLGGSTDRIDERDRSGKRRARSNGARLAVVGEFKRSQINRHCGRKGDIAIRFVDNTRECQVARLSAWHVRLTAVARYGETTGCGYAQFHGISVSADGDQ